MSISAKTVRFEGERIRVGLSDGRMIGGPLAKVPRVLHAAPDACEAFELPPV